MTLRKLVKTVALAIGILGFVTAGSYWVIHGTLHPTEVSWHTPHHDDAS